MKGNMLKQVERLFTLNLANQSTKRGADVAPQKEAGRSEGLSSSSLYARQEYNLGHGAFWCSPDKTYHFDEWWDSSDTQHLNAQSAVIGGGSVDDNASPRALIEVNVPQRKEEEQGINRGQAASDDARGLVSWLH
ncbi:hypothetical protein ACMFMG_009588 [Clarireedia jacksonii]